MSRVATGGGWRLLAGALGLAALVGASTGVAAPETRYHQFTKKYKKASDQAKVVAATYLGGPGTEWLVSGGFQPDGTVVVAGVALGPTLELGKAKVKVLGTDAAPPAAPAPKLKRERGKPVKDKKGKPVYEPFAWDHENATAFVVRMSSDLKTVRSASRFPWKAGGLTGAAVDEKGHIYLTGPARAGIKDVGGPQEELKAKKTGMKKGGCDQVYLAKLSPDAGKVLWLRTLKGKSDAPEVTLDAKGKLRLQSADLRTLSPEGEQEAVTVVPGGITTRAGSTTTLTTAVSPKDGTFVRAGEYPWPTGREVYRGPILNVHKPDGKLLYELYNWPGPLVGLDNLRLVSGSAIRQVRFDDDGNLVLYAWSDGGNSVLDREPFDVRTTSKKMDGLGFSAWGAEALSCAYLIKVDPKDYRVVSGTLWLAYLNKRNGPNTIGVDSLGCASDGSVCLAGKSAWGLIRTGNAVDDGEPAGTYVAVLSKECSSLRFSSTMPACGTTDVRDGARWGVVRGRLNGKPMALFLGGAVDNEEVGGTSRPAPTVRALQPDYGGGHSDGYLLLLDLSNTTESSTKE
jgi:hypothetical protein